MEDNENKLYLKIVFILFLVIGTVYIVQMPTILEDVKEDSVEYVYTTETTKGDILDIEAISGSLSVEYNTYIKLDNGDILRINNDNVYTYAKFNENKKVEVELTKGHLKEEGTADKKVKNTEKSKYISDVLVDGKSIKYID